MIDPIGEPNVRSIIRPEPNIEINEREVQTQRDQKIREARSIEKSENGSEIKNEIKEEEEKKQSAKYKQEEDRIVYEKYNKNGQLIFRIPPKSNPLDALA